MINLLEKHSWVLTATLSAVALLYAFLLFLPTQSDICDLRVERDQKQAFIANELKMREEITALQSEVETVQEFVRSWRENSAGWEELSGIYAQISDSVTASGTTTLRFEPQPVSDYELIRRVGVNMEVLGHFHQIFDLLARLESLPETIWVEKLSLETSQENRGLVQCGIVLGAFADNLESFD